MACTSQEKYGIIIGGGGHGLATLLKLRHGVNIAVLKKRRFSSEHWSHTTIIRSIICCPPTRNFMSTPSYRGSFENLNYNVMFSQRIINLAHTPAQMDAFARRGSHADGRYRWNCVDEISQRVLGSM